MSKKDQIARWYGTRRHRRIKGDVFYRNIVGAIKETIDAHGPINSDNMHGAAKRIAGQLKALKKAMLEHKNKCDLCRGPNSNNSVPLAVCDDCLPQDGEGDE